jgi:hypothetical protein
LSTDSSKSEVKVDSTAEEKTPVKEHVCAINLPGCIRIPICLTVFFAMQPSINVFDILLNEVVKFSESNE